MATQNPPDSPPRPAQLVNNVPVSSFEWCDCGDTAHDVAHLRVRTAEIALQSGKAIAISYGIGDFDRSMHVFGHMEGDNSRPVKLTFGGEWDITDLKTTLVKLCEQYGAIWFDQLSIPQDPDLISVHLQSMPEIYRTFEVVILWPTAPCPCLEERVNAYRSGESYLTDGDGDLKQLRIWHACLHAIPVSSYHFRLWTKQEFLYARKISLFYCGPPTGPCSRGSHAWSPTITKLSPTQQAYLGGWTKWKYEECVKEAALQQSEWIGEAAWSIFRDAYDRGVDNFNYAVWSFYMTRDIDFAEDNRQRQVHIITSFLLGDKLERDYHKMEDLYNFSFMGGSHVVSVRRDLALTIMLQLRSYHIPELWRQMSVPELVEDGLDQYERRTGKLQKTKLPRGLFEFEPGSMSCKPSLYLDATKIRDLGDIYSAIETAQYHPITNTGHVMMHIRGGQAAPPSRIMKATTYAAAFGNKSSSDAQQLMRKVAACNNWYFGRNRQTALSAWASLTIRETISAPQNSWASPAHQKAIFEELLHAQNREWDYLPEVDHETVSFDLICEFAGIHPEVARAKKLGLIVKVDDPPCIGLVNGAVYNGLRSIEEYQLAHGIPPPEARTTANFLNPEDWLSVVITPDFPSTKKVLVLEAMKSNRTFNPAWVNEAPKAEPIPIYMVIGVWFWSWKDDPFIGADLADSWSTECNAILL